MSGPRVPGRTFRRRSVAAGALLAAAAVLWFGFVRPHGPTGAVTRRPVTLSRPDPPPPDPRDVFPSKFRNAKRDVAYVGDAACAECHADVAARYHAHPMGRSADWVARARPIERYDAAAHNPFVAEGLEFRVEKVDGRVTHHLSAPPGPDRPSTYSASADVAIGSGTRGRTYLTVEGDRVWQSPVSWFSGAGRWDLSPHPELEDGGRRPVMAGCLFCHTDRVEPVAGAENRFREPLFPGQVAIGCERCHGPGELHVTARRSGNVSGAVDDSIVNPKHLPGDLRADVCRQCHLQGADQVVRRGRSVFEYRPGLPWDQFVTTFILPPESADYRMSVGQFEQMEVSRCFVGSKGALDCLSCHDPHEKRTGVEADRYFRDRCLACHESKGCSAPVADRTAAGDRCVGCHMPANDSSSVAHASVTDHRIPRRPAPRQRPRGATAGGLPLVPYPAGPHSAAVDERERDWGVALSRASSNAAGQRSLLGFAADKLAAALARWPGDAEAWSALAAVQGAAGDGLGAVRSARSAVAVSPESEPALLRLVYEAGAVEDFDTALGAANTLLDLNPTSVRQLVARAEIQIRRRDWERAEADARSALAIQPLQWKARFCLAVARHHRGDPAGARSEAETAMSLIPSGRQRTDMFNWYRQQTR